MQPPASAGSQPFAADQKPEESEGDEGPRLRRIIVASCVHGRVVAFYAPCLKGRNQILQVKSSKTVDMIRGYSRAVSLLSHMICPVVVIARRPADSSWAQATGSMIGPHATFSCA
jgi:hypothetical protein